MHAAHGFLQPLIGHALPWLYANSRVWTLVGLAGNALFGSRFLIQWLHSERHRKLIVPPIFWHLSFWGSIVQLLYGLHIDKLPVVLGYLFLPLIYARNLRFLRRSRADLTSLSQQSRSPSS